MDSIDPISPDLRRDYLATLNVLRYGKNAFFWLVVVAVFLHIFSWVVARHTGTLDPLKLVIVHTDVGDDGSPHMPTDAELHSAERWRGVLGSALSLGGFVGRSAALVLTGIFLISLLVSLLAGLGGSANFARACVWSLVSLALLMPWLRAPADVAGAASAFYGLDELGGAGLQAVGSSDGFLGFARFVLCPVLVAVFISIAQLRARDAHAQITAAPGAKLPIHEV